MPGVGEESQWEHDSEDPVSKTAISSSVAVMIPVAWLSVVARVCIVSVAGADTAQ